MQSSKTNGHSRVSCLQADFWDFIDDCALATVAVVSNDT